MGSVVHFGSPRVARVRELGTGPALASIMTQLARRSPIPDDHRHEPLFRKTTNHDELGVREVETCACGAHRVIERWASDYRTPATPMLIAMMARDGIALAADGSETTAWFRLGGDPS